MSYNVTYYVLSGPFDPHPSTHVDGYPTGIDMPVGTYTVDRVVTGATITTSHVTGRLYHGESQITGPGGEPMTMVRGTWLTPDGQAGVNAIDPIIDGSPVDVVLGPMTVFMLEDGTYILVEYVNSSIDWADPGTLDTFGHLDQFGFGVPTVLPGTPTAFELHVAPPGELHIFEGYEDNYSNSFSTPIPEPVCFAADMLIATARGLCPAGEIRPGDHVLTRDHGYRPVRWVGGQRLSPLDLLRADRLRPIRIAAGALGPGMPARDLMVSPQHRMLLAGPAVARLFGTAEVLGAAKHLVGLPGITVDLPAEGVTYVHLLLDTHEVLLAEGAWAESLYTGPQAMKMLPAAQRAEILTLFPDLAQGAPAHAAPARRFLTGREVGAWHRLVPPATAMPFDIGLIGAGQ